MARGKAGPDTSARRFGVVRGRALSSRNCEVLSTDAGRAGGPVRSSDEAPVTGVERRAGPSRVVCSINQSSWKESGGQVSVAREVVRYLEVGSVGGVSASQGQQGCTGSGWTDHRGVRDRPEEQYVQGLELNVLGVLLPSSGARGADSEG